MRVHLTLPFYLATTLGLLSHGGAVRAADAGKANVVPGKTSMQPTFSRHVVPFLRTYCISCHGGAKPKGDLALDIYKDEASAQKDREVWEKVVAKLESREMPPKGEHRPLPAPGEIAAIANWVHARATGVDCNLRHDPGRVTMRRLNRAEYNNTIRDLVGIAFQPADDFPADDVGYGFDNIGDVLSLPPLLLEKYLAAAEKIVELAFAKPETRGRIMICQPTPATKTDCARKILFAFARRAYRRPPTADEVDRLARLVQLAESQGDGFDTGIQVALQAVLVSPHFLFRIERDRKPNDPAAVHLVNDYELASRLSYFLWSSMPDEGLFRLAQQGTLRQTAVLDAQVRRMLKDPRARALTDNFASQWLQTRNLKAVAPDTGRFPGWDDQLRTAMQKETEMFFEAVVQEDRSILDFLDADFTFLNERLARHYGISGVNGDEFRRVTLPAGQRGGVLTQGSILTITSNPTRTSPVKRGKWILENILGATIPPPPAGAGELSEAEEVVRSGSLRKRMEQHRENPNCASCHQRMDPLGFGFENFDAIGAWRERDGKFPIDPSGTLPDGQSFKGPQDLKAILKGKQDAFRRCLAEKMLTYALGRGLESYDKCAVDQIAGAVARNGNKFSSLVLAIVRTEPFQMRRGKK